MASLKHAIIVFAAMVGSFAINLLGGWDTQLQTLTLLIAADVITGTLIALFWHKSSKSTRGAYDTDIAFKSGFKKLTIYLIVALGVILDRLFVDALGVRDFVRTSIILYYCGTEGASLVENLGIMGVPLPEVVVSAFEQLKDRGKNGDV